MDLGIGYWLTGFDVVGEAIDIARINLHRNESKNYYDILAEKYGLDRKQISDLIRKTLAVSWREHSEDMHRMLGVGLEQPPAPREFVYAAADYLNRQEER